MGEVTEDTEGAVAGQRQRLLELAVLCVVTARHALGGAAAAQPIVGHLEVWITHPAAGPYLSPVFWGHAPQFLVGEGARWLGLTGGLGGQGHGLVRLIRYEPAEALWVEQIGGRAAGVTGHAADHYPTLEQLKARRWYGDRKVFEVYLRGLTENEYQTLHRFLRPVPERYRRYTFGSPNCADLCAESWEQVADRKVPRGAFWFPLDLLAHTLNLPGKIHPKLRLLARLPRMLWRNRTPDHVARRLRRLGAPSLRRRAIGEVTLAETQRRLSTERRK